MGSLLLRLVGTALALYVATEIVPGMTYHGPWWGLLLVALVFGLVNALVRPVVVLLTCPFVILTLGLGLLLINAGMLGLTAWLAGDWLTIEGCLPAVLGSLLISLVSFLFNLLVGGRLDHQVKRKG
ncbi:MAG TPA: phage holin family protein [Thermoanaerobaculia bacterium]|nr:phage holin family protein [Thermoanaerobaculia bacterium]